MISEPVLLTTYYAVQMQLLSVLNCDLRCVSVVKLSVLLRSMVHGLTSVLKHLPFKYPNMVSLPLFVVVSVQIAL